MRNASTPVSCNYSDKYYELQNRGFTFLVRIYNEIPQTKVDFSFTFTESQYKCIKCIKKAFVRILEEKRCRTDVRVKTERT